jgi:hypothetical protein
MTSLWPRLAGLRLVVEGVALDRLAAEPSWGFERSTTLVRLQGAGEEGLGEDVSVMPGDEADALHVLQPALPLAGTWTLDAFCDHLATVEQWPAAPQWDMARRWRNWAFESAALDLALRQAGRALHEVLDLEPRPVRFVNSLGLGDPPSTATIADRLERYPSVGFKLDAVPSWTPEIMTALAVLGGVETIDFKGRYGLEVPDEAALVALYEAVLVAFPDVLLEDPHDLPEIAALLAPHSARVAFDAPVARASDVASATVNVKPSRIGGLRPLFELYAHCAANGVAMYGGGMGELGVARGQIELLASLFHPDGPNDVAPSAFNALVPPAGLPSSPLEPRPEPAGFRRRS